MAVTNRRGLVVGDVLRVGDSPHEEYVTVTRLSNHAATGPDPGTIVFTPPLTQDFPDGWNACCAAETGRSSRPADRLSWSLMRDRERTQRWYQMETMRRIASFA